VKRRKEVSVCEYNEERRRKEVSVIEYNEAEKEKKTGEYNSPTQSHTHTHTHHSSPRLANTMVTESNKKEINNTCELKVSALLEF
jgi:hypothetical protein